MNANLVPSLKNMLLPICVETWVPGRCFWRRPALRWSKRLRHVGSWASSWKNHHRIAGIADSLESTWKNLLSFFLIIESIESKKMNIWSSRCSMAVDFQEITCYLWTPWGSTSPRVNQGTLTRSRINSAAASESSDDDLGMTPKWLVIIGFARCGKPQYITYLYIYIYTIFLGSKFGGFISPPFLEISGNARGGWSTSFAHLSSQIIYQWVNERGIWGFESGIWPRPRLIVDHSLLWMGQRNPNHQCLIPSKLVQDFTTLHRMYSGWFGTWLFWLSTCWEWKNHPNWLSLHHFSEG